MIIYFADRQLNIIGQASTGLPKGLVVSDDLKTEDIETGIAVFDCKILYEKDTREKVKELTAPGNYVLRNNGDECELYSITEREGNTKKQQYYIYAEDDGLDLLNEVVGAFEADKAYPIEYYINKYAAGAGFEIGINEAASLSRQLAWDGESTASARIASIATQFDGCEVSYSFVVDGLNVVKKLINIYKERGKDVGATLRLNYDIDNIVTTESITNLATALQCTGGTPEDDNTEDDIEPQPITLKGYKYDDGDFYVDTDGILKSRVAFKKWARLLWKTDDAQQAGGHITRQFSYDTTSQKELCSRAITELKKYRDMEVNYEVEIKKFPDGVKIGDRVNIVDDKDELYLSARVLKLETSVANQEFKATIGEYLIKSSGIHQKVAEMAAQFAKTSLSAARALAIANKAKAAADDAQAQADSALADAQTAQQAADAATAAANLASESASLAEEKANAAQEKVDKVEESVTSLETTVANAQAAAEQAQQAAQTAETKAEEAQQAAVNAQTKAEEVETALAETKENAEAANAKADAAVSAADQAKADAEAAATTAAAAKLDAENAQKDIDALGENLTTLENTMSVDYARKTDLTETEARLQTQITQNADEISSTATKVQKIDETANDAAEKAEQAQSTAQAAQTKADQATADAQAAQTAADNAAAAATAAQNEADTAKAAAATAKSVADQAEADLEAAKADLATVTSRVDSTEEEIAAAQQAVTAAQTAADNAKADADAAAKKAADAQSTADTAVTNAATAQTKANEAASAANLAQQTADAAKGDAAAAQAKADEAASAAAEAQRTADTAKTNAANAQTKADEAATAAAAAQQAANDADAKAAQAATDLETAKQNLANVTSRVDATEEEVAAAQAAVETAQAAADKAQEEAEAAQATADTAKANAATAQTAANNAKTAADNAQAAADEAQAAADAAQADVDALAVRVTSAETKITQNSEQIALRATKEEVTQTLGGYYTKEETDAAITIKADEINSTVEEKFTGLQIGGRNLYTGTKDFTGDAWQRLNHWAKWEESTYKGFTIMTKSTAWSGLCQLVDVEEGEIYTLSAYIKAASSVTIASYFASNSNFSSNEPCTASYISGYTTTVGTDWIRIVAVAKIESSGVMAARFEANADVQCWICGLKLEKGNKATDWTPAPEDMASVDDLESYATKSELTQTAHNITAEVRSTYNNLTIGGRNLLLMSGEEITNNEYCINGYVPSSALIAGEEYMLSLCVTPAEGVESIKVFLSGGYLVIANLPVNGTEKQVLSCPFTAQYADGRTPADDIVYANVRAYRFPNDGTVTGDSTIHWVKVEKGNKVTDWTPAPEDMASADGLNTANENIQNINESISNLVIDTDAIRSSVSNVEKSVDGVSEDLQATKSEIASMQLTSEELEVKIQKINDDGVSKVSTTTGTFDESGLTIDSTESPTKTQVTPDGMTVYKKGADGDTEVLTATSDGVDATNLHAKTYLIIGGRSRFENYGTDRTGCFWIGG